MENSERFCIASASTGAYIKRVPVQGQLANLTTDDLGEATLMRRREAEELLENLNTWGNWKVCRVRLQIIGVL